MIELRFDSCREHIVRGGHGYGFGGECGMGWFERWEGTDGGAHRLIYIMRCMLVTAKLPREVLCCIHPLSLMAHVKGNKKNKPPIRSQSLLSAGVRAATCLFTGINLAVYADTHRFGRF